MELSAIRSLARPRLRTLRRSILSTLGMAAIVLGLLAMHSSGADHTAVGEEASAATAHTAHTSHAESHEVAAVPAATVIATAAAAAVHCDEACMHGVLDCALMVMTCSMLLAIAALTVLGHRPGLYRKLFDTGARILAAPARVPLPIHRPDLTVLSISRT